MCASRREREREREREKDINQTSDFFNASMPKSCALASDLEHSFNRRFVFRVQ